MKTKLRTDSKFIVKPENKVVVCNMRVDMQLIDSNLWAYMDTKWWVTKAPMVDDFGKFTVTAKARCNPNDTFDEVTGKRIAESRAKTKAFKIAKNVWNCIAKGLTEKANIANIMAKNCAAMEEIESNHVKELSE